MTRYQLYKLIRRNDSLKDERHPMLEKNRFMKMLSIFMFLYNAAILVLMGVMLPMGFRGMYNGVSAFHVMDGLVLYLLMTDFWMRFMLQETPAQRGRPYALLPIRRSFLMHVYLFSSGFSMGNLFWGFLLVPFGLLAVMPLLGWCALLRWLLAWWLLFIINGFCYLYVRTLISRHILWVLQPAAIHAALLFIMLWPEENILDIPLTEMMYQLTLGNVLYYLVIAALLAILYWANYRLQMTMVYNEVAQKEEVEMKHTTEMSYLNRYGALGEYLKLEMKMRMRNKTIRLQFLTLLGMMILLSGLLYFTDIYDNGFMKSFICLYDYVGLGMTMLISIMCHEGNYIDGLMSRRESILQLLYAKFYFNSAVLLLPFCLLIPLMIIGKISVWMNLGYLFFTAGVLYPICFQMAVYNKETLPLNQKLTSKQGNWVQQLVSIMMLFLPIGVEKVFTLLLGNPWGFVMLAVLGIVGLSLHQWWLRNIYDRFMLRRHVNMEGFRASR
ncbi:MAG: hypothetical protein IJT48_03420 [Bacteroidaceae bacterium]|nr:hypothetical protein [Bacteroidaceae bacterium]